MFAEVRVLAHAGLFAGAWVAEKVVTVLAAVDEHHTAGFVLGAGVTAYGYGGSWWLLYVGLGVLMTYLNGRDRLNDDAP